MPRSPWIDTVGRLSTRQLVSRVGRRLRQRGLYPTLGERLFASPPPLDTSQPPRGLDETAWAGELGRANRAQALAKGRFTFLGLPAETLTSPVDWHCAPEGNRLWQYELHYGQWALDLAHTHHAHPATGLLSPLLRLLEDWIEHNPAGVGVGWEPYPITRRLVAWTRVANVLGTNPDFATFWQQTLEPSLRRQTRFLARNLEHDVPNNHLLANYHALAWVGLACPHWPEADRWRRRGLEGLWKAMDTQVLADGVHDERSTSYHAIVLMDLLETWCLARREGVETPDLVATTLGKMLTVLATLRPPGSPSGASWPLLNDSVPGYPLDPDVLLHAGAALGLLADESRPSELRVDFELDRYRRWLGAPATPPSKTKPPNKTEPSEAKTARSSPSRHVFPNAGWAVWRDPDFWLLFDAGALGPDKVLGHGHADTLGFELHAWGRPRLVDPGVVTYEAGPWRDRLRATAAHNTVVVDGEDQCLFWGPFRVAHPPKAQLIQADDRVFEGEHDGYRRLDAPVVHRRRIERLEPTRLSIHDHFIGQGEHRFDLGLQWAPGASLRTEAAGVVARWDDGVEIRVTSPDPPPGATSQEAPGVVAGGWNQPIDAPRWVWSWTASAPCEHRLLLELIPADAAD